MMAKTATKTAAKPAAKVASKSTSTASARSTTTSRKAEDDKPRVHVTPPPRQQVPATVREHGGAIAISEDTSNLPDFMKGDVGRGTENIGNADMEVPRMKLMQGLSTELESYNELRAGHFFHTASETIFDEPFLAVPLYFERRYILWRPRGQGGGILARADDGVHWSPPDTAFEVTLDKKDGGDDVTWTTAKTVVQSGLADWGTMNPNDPKSPPAATLMYNFVLAFPEHPDLLPAVLTFQRSAIKHGRRFNTRLRTIRAPMFGLVFKFSAVEDTNGAGQKFFTPQATGAGRIRDEAAYVEYKKLYEGFSRTGLAIKDIEGVQDEGVGDNEPDAGENDGKPKY